jgi:hypothetical protein
MLGIIGCILFVLSLSINLGRLLSSVSHKGWNQENTLALVFLAFIIFANLSRSVLMDSSYIWFLYAYVSIQLSLDTNINQEQKVKGVNPYVLSSRL